ncbi:hypothetical protein [Helicobacter sp. T3_23-1056]
MDFGICKIVWNLYGFLRKLRMASVGGMIKVGSMASVGSVINFGGMIKNPPPPNGLQGVSRSKNPLRKGGGFESHKQTVIASERSERGTSPQLRSSDSAREREWAQLRKQNPQLKQIVIASKSQDLRGNLYPQNAKHTFDKPNKIDCHANANAFARNDGNANSLNGRISPSIADLRTSCPPSLAEGARGWVYLDSTADIAGKNATSSLRPLQRNAWQSKI